MPVFGWYLRSPSQGNPKQDSSEMAEEWGTLLCASPWAKLLFAIEWRGDCISRCKTVASSPPLVGHHRCLWCQAVSETGVGGLI